MTTDEGRPPAAESPLRRRLLDLAAQVQGAPDDAAALELMRAATGLSWTDPDADRAELDRRAAAAGGGLVFERPVLDDGGIAVGYEPVEVPVEDRRRELVRRSRQASWRDEVWPFTDGEKAAIRAAYEALTRVGNATADRARFPDDGWQPMLDRAHHDLGLVLVKIEAIDREQIEDVRTPEQRS